MKAFKLLPFFAVFACSSTPAVTPIVNPGITISSPAKGSSVTLDATKSVPIAFSTIDFTLKPAGTCAGAANCGHVHVLVDGSACTKAGDPYNNHAESSPAMALLASCPTATGSHTVTLELHNDDHSPVTSGGATVADSVTFTAN